MATYRQNRLNEEITRALGNIIRDVKERSIRDNVVTITAVSCAPDLSTARVYFSYIGSAEQKEIEKGLKNASGYMRSALARTLNLRQTPELIFKYDTSIAKGAEIEKILNKIRNDEKSGGDDEDEQ